MESSDSESDNGEQILAVTGSYECLGRDGTKWNLIENPTNNVGRQLSQNVFRAKSRVTPYCRTMQTVLDSFRLIIDPGFTRHIATCTNEYGNMQEEGFTTNEKEMEAFIGLLYLRSVRNQ